MPIETCPTPSNGIVAIASAGFMGLAAAIIVGALFLQKAQQVRVLAMCIVVLIIGAVAQLADKWMQYFVTAKHSVTVVMKPTPSQFGWYLPNGVATVLQSKPYIWLTAGPPHCIPGQQGYDPADCPGFDQMFPLLSSNDTIDVSVEAILGELGKRLTEVQIASDSNAGRLAAAQAGKADVEPPFSADLSLKRQ